MKEKTIGSNVAIVGGGLAGLSAANYLARAGVDVMVFEKSHAVGGRARTDSEQGYHFNLGPHALFAGGAAIRILRELGVKFQGRRPATSSGFAIDRGAKHTLPVGPFSMLTTGLFGLGAKLESARLLGAVSKFDARAIERLSLREWAEREIRHPDARRLFLAFIRVSTYADDPERQSAGAAIAQLQLALASGVLYLDGGWQTIVQGLRDEAEKEGVKIVAGARVKAVERDSRVRGLRLADGSFYAAPTVVVAAGPGEALELVEGSEGTILSEWAKGAVPVRAASLDVGLKYLPEPRALFALGIDRPLYFSVHSAAAKLAPESGAVIHAAKYLGANPVDDPRAVEQELEETLDLMQPGWRGAVVARRFLPAITVSNSIGAVARGGVTGRPSPNVPGIEGLYVAGDWVGPEGMLADASLASAKLAAETIARRHSVSVAAAA
ncbi:MAG TPA: NAD(P)/FAD-dependent oxidoreductase [Blastocatellia bacterium]|nr:NAD(P)/FAD-dependent oxidoreductase [Blastocatellia bacterium]